ncbi:capsule biosynthesis GfcC family protein [Halovivax cerinus]|uniref:Capsule biosynthesis GfcC family protein n=1 Tax=Halovivax cerinus TaxID=1487865 RepID=A0ABD5NSF8_9EURY|nr:capsule biosynthesis GfcC family protein [Halovivax cerinus]
MVDLDIVDTTIRATDAVGNVATVETNGWDRQADGDGLSEPVDLTVSGRVNGLSLPVVNAWVWTLRDGHKSFETQLSNDRTEIQLEAGLYHLIFETAIQILIEFDGTATLTRGADHSVDVSFPHPTAVTVGFRSYTDAPTHTVTIPRTATGVARALESFAVARRTTDPELASPLGRGHPPRIRFGDETDVPEAVRESIGQTGIELRVPDRLDALIPLASLAFYLGATVTVTDRDGATLRAPSVDLERELSPLPALQHEAADLLERIVFLDNLGRWATQDANLAELEAFETLGPDVTELQGMDMDERIAVYLDPDLAYDRLEPVLPPWHYTMYVEPTFDNVPSLPFFANRLARVYLSDAADGADRVGPTPGDPTAGADGYTRPFTGWLAPGSPAGPFLSRPAAYKNRFRYAKEQIPERVALVVTDDRRSDAAEAALEAYRHRPAYPTDVEFYEAATVAELRSVLEAGGEFVHYVGEVDGEAFVCTDGRLAIEETACAGRAVLLDAPTSLLAAAALVDQGAVAVVAQRGQERLEPETRRTLLELLGEGMAVDHVVQLARLYLGASDGLLTVGDGLCQVGNPSEMYVLVYRLTSLGDGNFLFSGDIQYPDFGVLWSPDFPESGANLVGNPGDQVIDASDLRTLVSAATPAVVVYEGECYFTDDLEPFYPAA